MGSTTFKQAFLTLFVASLLLAIYPSVRQQSLFLQKYTKGFHNFSELLDWPVKSDSTAVDTIAFAAVVPPLVALDSSKQEEQVMEDQLSKDLAEVTALEGTYTGTEKLVPFFSSIHERKEQVRIAYYGDSSIEGDLICMTFRDSLQGRFGGRGVGFVPLVSMHPGFRRSIHQAASNNWSRNVLGKKNTRQLRRGISGEFFIPKGAREIQQDSSLQDSIPPLDPRHWATFKGSKHFNRCQNFQQVKLFYGQPKNYDSTALGGYVRVKVDAQQKELPLAAPHSVNCIALSDTACQRIRLDFQSDPELPIYGVSIESKRGVIVDNFPLRGIDGGALKYIKKTTLEQFQQHLDYDLLVFQFGLNVMNPKLKDYSWYQKRLEELILHYQNAMPGVPILLIGVSDKGTKINGRMQTDPSIPRITEAQRRAAQNTGVAFFSLYEGMGGEGTMVSWVEDYQPKLANVDYTHFNFRGARKVSYLLVQYIQENYMDFVVNGY